jgi:cold shock CspA family protein/ribosome-associated translation inhibitor RaiA
MTMQIPLQITFRNMESSPEAERLIDAEARKLETFHSRLMGCRVAVEVPHGHHRAGRLYHVRIDLTLPGKELVIKHEPSLSKEIRQTAVAKMQKHLEVGIPHRNLYLAITDAFKIAGRRLQDYAHRQRGDVKTHESTSTGRVSKLLSEKGYGFLTTPDGREVYFYERSVLHQGFPRLKVGSEVSFVEERGEKGPQASTVRIRRNRVVRRTAEKAAGATG